MKDFRKAQDILVKAAQPLPGSKVQSSMAAGRILMNQLSTDSSARLHLGEVGNATDLRYISPALAARLQAEGCDEVTVKRQAQVLVLPAGEPDDKSLHHYLQGRLEKLYAEATISLSGSVAFLEDVIQKGADHHLVLILGGDGPDLLKAAFDAGHEVHFSKVDIAPAGDTFAFSTDERLYIWCENGLDDLLVTTELFIVPYLRSLSRITAADFQIRKAELKAPIDLKEEITTMVPAELTTKNGVYQVRPVRNYQERGNGAWLFADCIIIADPEQFVLDKYSIVDVVLMNRGLE